MRADEIETARQRRDTRVAVVLGLDLSATYGIEVRTAEHEVWWRHTGPGEWPQHHGNELAAGEHPKLGRVILHPDQWAEVSEADEEFGALFANVPTRWMEGMKP